MNVLVLSDKLWPEGGGGELATYLYIKLLIERNVNVKVAISSTPNYFKAWSGLSIYRIPVIGYGKYTILPMLRGLRRLLEWSDLVYCTGFFSLIPLIKQAFKKPVIVHLHSYFPVCPIGPLYNFEKDFTCKPNDKNCSKCIWRYERTHMKTFSQALTSMLLNSTIGKGFLNHVMLADALLFVSNAQRNLFLKHARSLQYRSCVIYNPLPDISYIPIEGDDVGYFGGLSLIKGFHVLLKAWSKIFLKHKARIHVAMFKELSNSKQLKDINLIPYVKLSGTFYEDVYRKVKVVCVPSICQEPLPYVVIEALLRGRLLIASKVGGIPEIVSGLKGTLLVKPDDVDNLADALDWALSVDRSKAVELGLKNREDISKRFSNSKSIEKLMKIFEKVIS